MQRQVLALLWSVLLLVPVVVGADGGDAGGGRPDAPPDIRAAYETGYQHVKAGRYRDAIDVFKQVVRHDPTHAMAYTNMAYAYRQLKSYKRAVKLYDKALALDPNLAEAHEYKGEALLALGKVKEAKRHLAILEQLNPDMAEELRAEIERHGRS